MPAVTGDVAKATGKAVEPEAQGSSKTAENSKESIAGEKLGKFIRKSCLLASIFLDNIGSKPLCIYGILMHPTV